MKKKVIFSFLSILIVSNLFGQTYRNSYDVIEKNSYYAGQGMSFRTNASRIIHSYGTNFLQSYINMYETTKDIKYLNEFVIHAKRVMDRRNDFIATANPVIINSNN
jgi:hypothetical protein